MNTWKTSMTDLLTFQKEQPYVQLLKLALLFSVVIPILSGTLNTAITIQILSLIGVVLPAFLILLLKGLKHFSTLAEKIGLDHKIHLENEPESKMTTGILCSAAVGLFLEIAMIRWQGAVFPLFAFYKNYSLLACFLGLGIGYALAKDSRILLIWTLPLLTFQIFFLNFWRYLFSSAFYQTPFSEQLNMGMNTSSHLSELIEIYSLLIGVFLLTVLTFIPLGQLCGKLMTRKESLKAYGLNLLGSMLGIFLISFLSFLWTQPVLWFSLAFLAILFFQRFETRALFIGSIFAILSIIILDWPLETGTEKIYSPYQLLERGPGPKGITLIKAAGMYYQRILNLAPAQNQFDESQAMRNYYELPYHIYGKPADQVAIVGAGSGNDVAAALRRKAKQIDAIEIDPVILKMGTLYHPEQPYSNVCVNAIENDARTFLRNTSKQYDLIVYGLLDSHTLLSHASSVRLDSFVYTIEAFKEARSKLKPEGLLSLSFSILSTELGRKIYLMLQQAFENNPPVCIRSFYDGSITFLQSRKGPLRISPQMIRETGFENVTFIYENPHLEADVSTDDWPFFYIPKRQYPFSYLKFFSVLLLISLGITFSLLPQKPNRNHFPFFFLGAGFMLVETKAITELGLLFGNTWQVIGVVILSVLIMAFLANLWIQYVPFTRLWIPSLFLILSILAGYWASQKGGLGSSPLQQVGGVLLLTCPLFFSGMLFSLLLKQDQEISKAMGSNLLGSMIGGILEYNSMYFGFSFLYLIALTLYLIAFISIFFRRSPAP